MKFLKVFPLTHVIFYMLFTIAIMVTMSTIRHLFVSIIITLSLIIINSIFFGFWIWRQRIKEYKKLSESEEKYRYLFNNSTIGLLITELTGEIDCNKAFRDMTGYSSNEMKKWQDISHPEDIPFDNALAESMIRGKSDSCRFVKRYIHKNGGVIWADVNAVLRRDSEGNPLYFLAAISDITERKKSEDLKFLQKRIADIFLIENKLDVYQKILEEILEFLESPCGLFGYVNKEGSVVIPAKKGMHINNDLIFTRESWRKHVVLSVLKERKPTISNESTLSFPESNKIERFISFPVISQYDVIGMITIANKATDYSEVDFMALERIVNYIAPILDAHLIAEWTKNEIVRINNELERKVFERTSQLEESNRELESFNYSVSHDLRMPLRAISGFTKILEENYSGRLDDEAKRLCTLIVSSTEKMGELIDSLLKLSRIGRSIISPKKLDINSLVASVYDELTCTVELKPEIDIKNLPDVYADPGLMKIVWNNLLSNAIKYSSKTKVPRITVDAGISRDKVTYSVTDNGAGFDMKYYSKLFGVFQRLHSQAEFEGNGVGLAIVNRIITRHNGKVWADARPGKGATFFISLPA